MTVTQPCADATLGRAAGDHTACAGFVGGPSWPCDCDCHPAVYSTQEYAEKIVRFHLGWVRSCPATTYKPEEFAARLVRDLEEGGVLDVHGAVDVR